jgi:hypothetical protein
MWRNGTPAPRSKDMPQEKIAVGVRDKEPVP